MSLQNKVAIITGAGKGIGRATALALAEEGVFLCLIARTETELQKVAEEVDKYDVRVAIASADVSDYTQVEKAVEKLYGELGTFDILINNAGIAKFGSFLELPVEEWEQIVKVKIGRASCRKRGTRS